MKTMLIETKKETIKILLSEVCYIISHPTKPHYVQVFTENVIYEFPESLKHLEELYPGIFFRSHRSCLVNLLNIKEIHKNERVILFGDRGEHKAIFSRRKQQLLLKHWLGKEDI